MQNRSDRTGDADRIRRRSLGISFFMHCAGLLVLFASPGNKNSKTPIEILPVRLIDIPEMEIPKQPPVQEETIQPEKNISKSNTRTEVKPAVKAEKPDRYSTRKVPEFSAEKFRDKLISKLEKPEHENQIYKPSAPAPVKVEKIENSITEVNVSRLNLTIPQWYISLVQSRIKENWRVPNMFGGRTTTVSFRIYNDGRIENIALERSSGNTGFDKTVINAVRSTKNLPHFPQEISESQLDVVIDFKTEG